MCPCPVEGCNFGGFANTFNKYDEKLKKNILRTGLGHDEECRLTPCFKLDDLDFGEDKYRFKKNEFKSQMINHFILYISREKNKKEKTNHSDLTAVPKKWKKRFEKELNNLKKVL